MKSRAPFYQRKRREMAHQLPLNKALSPYGRDGWTPDDWATPWPLVRELEAEFGAFELDPAATSESAKAPRFFTKTQDGLGQPWAPAHVFLNPPYSDVETWIRKAILEADRGGLVVAVLPARTDRNWWHDLLTPNAEIRFQRGRQRFIGPDGTTIGRPVFATAIAIFRPSKGKEKS
jgi:phage N-6-adenine-methyltransferase